VLRADNLHSMSEADVTPQTPAATGTGPLPPQEPPPPNRLTPRQARRLRSIVSGVVMAAVAVALVLRVDNAPSVVTVGFYGVALILSGTAIVLSRRGRTRVATAVLLLGFAAVALAERLLASAQ
jgi:hypothetical protein